ncbi:MAG: DUF111 family protein [Saprospiraceae bacterium]|nr:DUF111 family protein [Saprospiraceae bacterium]
MIVETNLDDTSSELIGTDFQEGLLQAGAIDFYFSAIQMKKGRPGLKLSVLIAREGLDTLGRYILENSSTIGLRYYPVDRVILERKSFKVHTPYGPVKVKQVTTPEGNLRRKIEYESLQNLKEKHNISILRLQEELYPIISKHQNDEEE